MGALLVVTFTWLWWCLPCYLVYEDFRRHIPALQESRKSLEDWILAPLLLVLAIVFFIFGFWILLLVLPFGKVLACTYIYLMLVTAYLRNKEGPRDRLYRYGQVLFCLIAAVMVFGYAFL